MSYTKCFAFCVGVCILTIYIVGCASAPCWDVSVSGQIPTGGYGTARGELCAPEPKETK